MSRMKASGSIVIVQVCALALASLMPLAVLADGRVIPQRAFALPQIPDQQALLHYSNGVETLVIETSFVGQGTNFAWIVPLPAVARIEPVSAGVFPTLQTIFQPEVALSVHHYWLALPIAALMVGMLRLFRGQLLCCLLLFCGCMTCK
jgi:hypothetical protein